MTKDLSRLLNPKSIALFGGSWAENVIVQLQKSGFSGDIWPVHPKRESICGLPCIRDISELPSAPDASFVGEVDDITYTARVEVDLDSNPNDFECYSDEQITAWKNEDWFFGMIIISAEKNGWVKDHLSVVGAYDCNLGDDNSYLLEAANEQLKEAIEAAKNN